VKYGKHEETMETNIGTITETEVKSAISGALEILRRELPAFAGKFKGCVSVNNFYTPTENDDWTNGFHTGQYWLAWELSRETDFKNAALAQVESFRRRIKERISVDHHDMGFLYSLSCVAAFKLTGNESAKEAAIMAADNLISRFHEKGSFIQAWGALGARNNYRLIIDCLMNLPLLYWASGETGNPVYRKIALIHMETSLRHLVRDDFSTYHTFFFNPDSGAPEKGVTAQGFRDSSPWARGQAWGIYGLALSYFYTGNPECIRLFYGVADFFISRLPADFVCYWDLDFDDKSGEPKDSSAAAIAACGMLEMSKHLPKDKADYYREVSARIAGALARSYAVRPGVSNGLLLHGVYGKSSPYNTVSNNGVDECNLWGDYFWLELLARLQTDWKMYW